MFREQFARQQSVAYQTLKRALESDKLSHAYIFSGASGALKKEAAYLLAQSLICENRTDFACEECELCRRIADNQYADIIYLDGSKESIKKQQVLDLQQQFNRTGLEIHNQKIYIIDQAENATPEALNSLLKFLEEPGGNTVTAILIAEQIDRLLPTIVSRCQIIHFKSLRQEDCFAQALEKGVDRFDAYVLSQLTRNTKEIEILAEEENYQAAVTLFKTFIQNLLYNVDMSLTRLQLEGFSNKNRSEQREVLHYILDLCLIFFKDLNRDEKAAGQWWQEQQNVYQKKAVNNQALIQIFLEAKDRLTRNINVPLLVDQILAEVKEVL